MAKTQQLNIASDVSRAQLELQLLGCPEVGTPTGTDSDEKPAGFVVHIKRNAMLMSAWTRSLVAPASTYQRQPPKGSCLAVCVTDGGASFTCDLMKGLDLVRPMQVKPGSHAFVKCLDEPFLRVALMAGKVHRSMMLH
jgi:hypothetical protein